MALAGMNGPSAQSLYAVMLELLCNAGLKRLGSRDICVAARDDISLLGHAAGVVVTGVLGIDLQRHLIVGNGPVEVFLAELGVAPIDEHPGEVLGPQPYDLGVVGNGAVV